MTDITNKLNRSTLESGSGRASKHRSHRMLRRKLSLYSAINHHLDKLLRTRKIFRAGFVLLPLAGFLHVSLVNDVLSPGDRASNDLTVVAPINAQTTVPELQQANAWPAGGPTSSRLPPGGADVVGEAPAGNTNAESIMSATAAIGGSFGKTNTYVVNEGGSLWRTGKRFIDDDVLLDKLIDSLSESGMNVRSVSAGIGFIVNDLGSKGLLVVVEDDGNTYESHIVKDSVTSSVRPQAATGFNPSRMASLEP